MKKDWFQEFDEWLESRSEVELWQLALIGAMLLTLFCMLFIQVSERTPPHETHEKNMHHATSSGLNHTGLLRLRQLRFDSTNDANV